MKDRSWIQRMLERSVPSSLRSDRGQVEVGEKEGESLSILSCVQMILLFYYPYSVLFEVIIDLLI